MNADGDPIRDYIRANMRTNTREAIVQQLVAAGHDQARIDAVWHEESRAMSVARAKSTLTGVGLSLFIVLGLLGALGALAIGGMSGSYGLPQLSLPLFWLLYAILYLTIGYGILRLIGWAIPRFGITGWLAGLMGLLMVAGYAVLMFGGCLATYGIAQQVAR
jgi:hypothetical protein